MLCELTYVSSLASPHFEALCIQTHTYKYAYVIAWYACTYMNPRYANSHMFLYAFALESVHTANRFVYIDIFRSVHIFYHWCVCIWADVVQTYVCLCPFRLLTLRTCFYTYIYSQVLVYMYSMMYSFVSEPLLCKIPYVGALASAHTLKLLGCMQKLTSIHMFYHRCDCIWTDILQTHICLCPWECSQLESLCIYP